MIIQNSKSHRQDHEVTIGLEIHAELKTDSKMFCCCANAQAQTHADVTQTHADNAKRYALSPMPNWNVCPVCLGMPGMLPVLNKQAIEWTILTGLALNCKIAEFTKWDRKNYFYPDLPKGYQISQYDLPICQGGWLEINSKLETLNSKQTQNSNNQNSKQGEILHFVQNDIKNKSQISNLRSQIMKWGITRIHLEEDTGTSKHPEGKEEVDYSLIDYNRAGVPLMELVTDAITVPIDQVGSIAKEFCQKYQLCLRRLGVADANMEKGQMRCEVNISLRDNTDKNGFKTRIKADQIGLNRGGNQFKSVLLGTKVEIKNLNSFKAVERAIEYEIERQSETLDRGEKVVQETRGWDDAQGKTYTMRIKETSADYRYFPEPDLPAIRLVRGTTPKNFFLSKGLRPLRTEASSTGQAQIKQAPRNYADSHPEFISGSKERFRNKFGMTKRGYLVDAQNDNLINIEEIRKQLPETIEETMRKYLKLGLNFDEAELIIYDLQRSKLFDQTVNLSQNLARELAVWIINDIKDFNINPKYLVELIQLVKGSKVSKSAAKEILPAIYQGQPPSAIIKARRLEQISDSQDLEKIIDQVLSQNSALVAKIKSGKPEAIGFLVGQVMKISKGQANPKMVNEILKKKIR